MEVAFVDEGEVDVGPAETSRGAQPAEACSDDDHAMFWLVGHVKRGWRTWLVA